MIASHLLKWVHCQRDLYGEQMELRYVRDTDKREVDFCITKDFQPLMIVESKWGDRSTSAHLHYLKKKFPEAKYYQVSATGEKQYINKNNVVHIPAVTFLQQLV